MPALHRLQHRAHRLGALLPRELAAADLRLGAELVAKHRIGQQAFEPVDQSVVIVDQQAGDPVDDRIGQPARGPVTDGGHPVLAGLDHRQRPALFARRQHMDPRPLQDIVFGGIVDVAVERHRIGDAQQLGVLDQALFPPAAAQDVQVHARNLRAQFGDGLERVFDLLVRHQT